MPSRRGHGPGSAGRARRCCRRAKRGREGKGDARRRTPGPWLGSLARLAPPFRSVSASLEREGPARHGPHSTTTRTSLAVTGHHTRESTAQTPPVGLPVGPSRFRAPTAPGLCARPSRSPDDELCSRQFLAVGSQMRFHPEQRPAGERQRQRLPRPRLELSLSRSHRAGKISRTVSRPQVLENPIRVFRFLSEMLCYLFSNENVVSLQSFARARAQIRKSNDRSTGRENDSSSIASARR